MAGKLKARTPLTIISGGYEGEGVGSSGGFANWTEVENSDSTSVEYFFHDSDVKNDNNGSRVMILVSENWDYTIDENNYAHVTLKTTINSIVRDTNKVTTQINPYRNIKIWDKKGGKLLFQKDNDYIASTHIIHNSWIKLDTKTFTIAPGGHTSFNWSIYLRSNTVGHDDTPPPSEYVDEMALGIEFLNDLPPDYRPGAILNTDGKWYSHNRHGGKSHILLPNGKWKEMRTLNGHSTNDNPPSIYRNGKWTDQLKIGKE